MFHADLAAGAWIFSALFHSNGPPKKATFSSCLFNLSLQMNPPAPPGPEDLSVR